MSLKDDLRPTGRNRVIDLVQAAGVNVADWGNYSRGPAFASVNPKYCYEWAFVDPSGIVVLNRWHRNIEERGGAVSVTTNMRKTSREHVARKSKDVWIKRSARMDDAIRLAFEAKAKVRVIVNDGDMRTANDPKAKASVVRGRLLDPVPWSIKQYDAKSGQCVLVRGDVDALAVDQFQVQPPGDTEPERVDVHGMAFVRSAAVRAAVLIRAKKRCEFCGQPGFVTKGGGVFLETHHIIPLSEGGADTVENAAAVCPTHHREAHHGASAAVIRDFLLEVATRARAR